MAGLTRYLQQIFGSTAASGRMSQYGSLQAGSPVTYSGSTINPDETQSLSNYASGLDGSVIAKASPAIQDLNSLFNLFSYQLAYILERGIPEYLSTQTYNTNDICQSSGVIYQSSIDSNTGNTPSSSPSDWAVLIQPRKAPTLTGLSSGSGTYTTPAGVLYLKVQAIGGGGGGGSNSGTSAGASGTSTTFGTITCNPGTGGSGGNAVLPSGGAGGTSTFTGYEGIALPGGSGQGIGTNSDVEGGMGGNTIFGGAGGGGSSNQAGYSAASNTGAGGGGSGGTVSLSSGGGGGSGGSVEVIIRSPSATYSYSVGSGGSGEAGTEAGGNGGSGVIIVTEYYA